MDNPPNQMKSWSPGGSRQLVFTLVHGTFSSASTWPRRSALRTQLERAFPSAMITSYQWSGANSSRKRLIGAAGLVRHLHSLGESDDLLEHVLIAHSHGGHIVLYALRDELLRSRTRAVVTLGTPFLVPKRRNTEAFKRRLRSWGPFRVVFFLIGLSAMPIWLSWLVGDVLKVNWKLPSPSPDDPEFSWVMIPVAIGIALLSIGCWIALVPLAFKGGQWGGKMMARLTTWIECSQQDTVESLRIPNPIAVPVFACHSRGDEAFWHLAIQRAMGRLFLCVYESGLLLPILPAASAVICYIALFFSNMNDRIAVAFGISAWSFAGMVLCGALLEIAAGVALLLFQGHMLAFGTSPIGMHLWSDVRVSRGEGIDPSITQKQMGIGVSLFRRACRGAGGLTHCMYYDSPGCVREVISWLSETLRESDSAG